MAECKACGIWFSSSEPQELCPGCERALERLNGYVVPVVRCKDCKHFWHYGKTSLFINGKNIKAGWCQRRIRYDEECRMTADDFCSYGERKDGDD